jgi:hypothetical protein
LQCPEQLLRAPINSMTEEDGAQRTAAARLKGQAFLDQVIVKATEGKDPFQLEPPKTRGATSTDAAAAGSDLEDPDVVAFGRFFERHRVHLVLLLFVAAQSCSWVLMKVRHPHPPHLLIGRCQSAAQPQRAKTPYCFRHTLLVAHV